MESQIGLVKVISILVLRDHSSPFLILNVPDTFTVGKVHQKRKKNPGDGTQQRNNCFLSLKINFTQEAPLALFAVGNLFPL